jgi:hypothetical protein
MEAIYVLRVRLPEGYDGPVLDEASLMVSALNNINGGEDEVPVKGVSCERVDAAPLDHRDDAIAQRIAELEDEQHGDPAYNDGWHDALREAMGEGSGSDG